MDTYAFRTSINIKCGCGSVESLGSELMQLGFKQVYFVTDPGLSKAGLSDRVTEIMAKSGIAFSVFDSIEPNPRDTTIEVAWEKRLLV
jgi:alcohol dehydrogenase class IV